MKTIAVGDTCIDYYDNLDRWYPTGNCVDFAVNLADAGCETAILAWAGDDGYGQSVLDLLKEHKVDTSRFRIVPGSSPMTHMTLGGESGRDRIHGSFDEGVMSGFTLTRDDLRHIAGFDLVHTHKYGRADAYLPEISGYGCRILYDFSTSWSLGEHREVEEYVDYGFWSCKEDSPAVRTHLQEAVRRYGMKAAVATLGEAGSLACVPGEDTPEEVRWIRCAADPVPDEELVNTVGAGDSYIAGFAAGLMRGMEIEDCMKTGAEISARIVRVFEPFLPAEQ